MSAEDKSPKTQLPQTTARGWKHFVETVVDRFPIGGVHPSFVFRGQADSSWDLSPHLTRLVRRAQLTEAEAMSLETFAAHTFQAQAHLYLPAQMVFDNDELLGWWAVMQHYGVPTRLLDWTASPFVAAYFAVESCESQHGTVLAVSIPRLENAMRARGIPEDFPEGGTIAIRDELLKQKKGRLYIRRLRRHTDRMEAQQTLFSVSPDIFADHATVIRELITEPEKTWLEIVIPSELKREFLHRLREMNLTARALFPGIDGLGRSVAEIVRLGSVSRKPPPSSTAPPPKEAL